MERTATILISSFTILLFSGPPQVRAQSYPQSPMEIKQAIKERVCFEAFWWDHDTFQLGKTSQITIRNTKSITYVWSNDLSIVPGVAQWDDFFTVFTKGSQSVVGASVGFNVAAMQYTPLFEQSKNSVFGPGAETVALNLPANCAPHFEKDNSIKKEMLRIVMKTVATELLWFDKSGLANYPHQTQIVISNFNIDYPETLVLLPITNQVFHVALHDSSNPLSDAFMQRGQFPIQPEYGTEAINELRTKIIKYGLMRQITLGDGT